MGSWWVVQKMKELFEEHKGDLIAAGVMLVFVSVSLVPEMLNPPRWTAGVGEMNMIVGPTIWGFIALALLACILGKRAHEWIHDKPYSSRLRDDLLVIFAFGLLALGMTTRGNIIHFGQYW